MIRAVIFDYGNVISTFDSNIFWKKVIKSSEKSSGEILKFVHESESILRGYELGLISSESLFNSAREACGIKLTCEDFFEAWGHIFTPITETRDLIRRFKPCYKLGLISNTCECHFIHEIEKADIYPLFDAVSLSFLVHSMKPDPEIFKHQLAALDVSPSESVYIDDIPQYAQAARNLGFHAVCFTGYNGLVKDLKRLGIEV